MKTNPNQRRGFTLVELLVVIVIIASLAGLTAPMVIRQRKKADQTEATSNARQIGLALFEFDSDYSSFPEDSTAGNTAAGDPVLPYKDDFGTLSGSASNDYFRQLFAAGIVNSEEMFFSKDGDARKPDGIADDGTTTLATGECGFAYIMKSATEGLSTAVNPSAVVVATPAIDASTFNETPFDGKAVVLKIDQSVSSINIKDGKAQLQGKDLLTGGDGTIWGAGIPTPTMVPPAK